MQEQVPQISALVRTIRAARSLIWEGLARELGVSVATVSGCGTGRHPLISVLTSRLAELAGHAASDATEPV